MSSLRIQSSKYYRLSRKQDVETKNVSALIDISSRMLSVFVAEIEKERIPIFTDKSKYPRIMFRHINMYVLFSTDSSDGFRLTFDACEKLEFLKTMHSMGCLLDHHLEDPTTSSSQELSGSQKRSGEERRSEIRMETSEAKLSSRPSQPRFVQQPTPAAVRATPNLRRESTSFLPRYSESSQASQSSQKSSRTVHEYGESVPKKSREYGKKPPIVTADKNIQTDDLMDVLIEDEEFTKKAMMQMMKDEKFVKLVATIKSRLEGMETLETRRIHWKTDPKQDNQRMPPPLIHLPTSDMEK